MKKFFLVLIALISTAVPAIAGQCYSDKKVAIKWAIKKVACKPKTVTKTVYKEKEILVRDTLTRIGGQGHVQVTDHVGKANATNAQIAGNMFGDILETATGVYASKQARKGMEAIGRGLAESGDTITMDNSNSNHNVAKADATATSNVSVKQSQTATGGKSGDVTITNPTPRPSPVVVNRPNTGQGQTSITTPVVTTGDRNTGQGQTSITTPVVATGNRNTAQGAGSQQN